MKNPVRVRNDLTGLRFGKLTVVKRAPDYIKPKSNYGESRWECLCDCGNTCMVLGYRLRALKTRSCGCLKGENNKIFKKNYKGFNSYTIKDNIVYIQLQRGKITLCDLEDLQIVSQYRWHEHNGYAAHNTKIPNQKKTQMIMMHQLIMGRPYIDHINGNPLDNRRVNLRPYNHPSYNAANHKKRIDNSTGYIGVKLHRGKYEANVNYKGKRYYCGSFNTPEEAARARDSKAKELFGDYTKLNFPEEE